MPGGRRLVFAWIRDKKRRAFTAQPFPESWRAVLKSNVPQYAWLTELERARLEDDLRIFIGEKSWEGCQGLVVTEEMQVTIAAYAILIALQLPHDFYPNVESILIYPTGFSVSEEKPGPFGTVMRTTSHRAGEAWSSNLPVVISWSDALAGARRIDDGFNVIIHEFAHKLDGRGGVVDGVPQLPEQSDYDRWEQVMSRGFQFLVSHASAGIPTVLNPYGASGSAEFFAVATECFFERPVALAATMHDLYSLLCDFYGVDLASRLAGRAISPEPALMR